MFTRRDIFFRHIAQTSLHPPAIEISGAEGIYLTGPEGKRYIDFISGISVSGLGHGNKDIIDAIVRQVNSHMHLMVYGEYVIGAQADLAGLLASLLPPQLSTVYFTNSGSEATEGAMKLAKRYTGRAEIISFRNAYHGSTQGALSICGNDELKQAYRPLLPGNRLIGFNSFEQLQSITEKTAAVFAEPVQSEAGVIMPEGDFLKSLRQRCTETGALLVFDEIQTGMGRTGTMFAFERFGIVPDILLLGKGFGGGMPLGAFISSQEIMSVLSYNPVLGHMTTFGGHPVSCAASFAALQVISANRLFENAAVIEKLLRNELRHPAIEEIRGCGLLMSLKFGTEKLNRDVIAACEKNNLLTDWFLFAPDCLRMAPPLTITKEEAGTAAGIILQSIDEVA